MSCLPAQREGAGKQLHREPTHRSANPALDGLRAELGDDNALECFLSNYLSLLDQRIAEIGRHLEQGRVEDCITMLLTVETSSDMVGATELSLRAAALRLALGHRQTDTTSLYELLVRAGSLTHHLLSEH